MYIVAIAWIYVILMMAITENSVTAGVLTFLFYGILPVSVILYLMGTPQRKRNRQRDRESAMTASTIHVAGHDIPRHADDASDANPSRLPPQ